MPKFAHYNAAGQAPQPVIGWYDTDEYDYPNLPPIVDLLVLTQEQWNGRFSTSFVQNGVLVAAPPPTAAQLLAAARAEKLVDLSAACAAQIYAGFASSALGAPHTYPTNDKDQVNLSASVTASLIPNLPANWTTDFWCADGTGMWALRPHTAAQIQQAGIDGKTAIETAIRKNATLAAQVMDPNATLATVQAVVW